jgi:hypothetical protein
MICEVIIELLGDDNDLDDNDPFDECAEMMSASAPPLPSKTSLDTFILSRGTYRKRGTYGIW